VQPTEPNRNTPEYLALCSAYGQLDAVADLLKHVAAYLTFGPVFYSPQELLKRVQTALVAIPTIPRQPHDPVVFTRYDSCVAGDDIHKGDTVIVVSKVVMHPESTKTVDDSVDFPKYDPYKIIQLPG
jgi:hypothetical protein